MRESITIASRVFTVTNPFAEGHVLNGPQADALNQVFHENIRNNLAKKLEGLSDTDAQTKVTEYENTYEFGVRTGGGGGPRDPIHTEAMRIAREAVKRGLQRKGVKISGDGAIGAKEITAYAEKALAKHPEWLDTAKATVEANRAAAGQALDEILAEAAE